MEVNMGWLGILASITYSHRWGVLDWRNLNMSVMYVSVYGVCLHKEGQQSDMRLTMFVLQDLQYALREAVIRCCWK